MTSKKRVAVVTDAVSSDFFFPLWHKYYSDNFGSDNLHVICFNPNNENAFVHFPLGNVAYIELFNNSDRAKFISDHVSRLLDDYDYVIRVDVDEFLLPNPNKFPTLRAYIDAIIVPNVTAFGYNVLQSVNDQPLDLSRDIIRGQRKFAVAYDALNKTCVVSSPTTWLPGFHVSSHSPVFSDLYMFHLKLADIDLQLRIGASVAEQSNEEMFKAYHTTPRDVLMARNASYFLFPTVSGFDNFNRREHNDAFIARTKQIDNMFHTGEFAHDRVLLEIPKEFDGYI